MNISKHILRGTQLNTTNLNEIGKILDAEFELRMFKIYIGINYHSFNNHTSVYARELKARKKKSVHESYIMQKSNTPKRTKSSQNFRTGIIEMFLLFLIS